MDTTFGERLLALLHYRGYTQSSFARHIGIPISTLNSYIKTSREPSYDLLYKFCDELDCTLEYLLDYKCQRREIYRINPAKINQNLTAAGYFLKIDPILILAWFEGQIELDDKDVMAIQKFMNLDNEMISILETNKDLENRIIDQLNQEYVASLLNKLTHDELEDVEKYIDFIISKRKS